MPRFLPKDDPKQALRIKRSLMAGGSYLMWAALVAYCTLSGHFRMDWATSGMWFLGAVILLNVLIYIVFRTGLNRKFRDPSLTMIQMGLATLAVMITVYFADTGTRGVFLLIYTVVFVFGFFRLRVGQFVVLTGVALAGYGTSIGLLYLNHPARIEISLELLRLIILASVLLWFSMVGAYVNRLRREVVSANHDLKKAMATIEEMAVRDPLTGVFNRRKLTEIMENEIKRAGRYGKPFCICLFDLDHFKDVNDRFGHLNGDAVLKDFCSQVARILRTVDTLARYGGEEFVVVLPETHAEGALAFAERARKHVRSLTFPDMPQDFRITVSVGVTCHSSGQNVETLFSLADTALYQAKSKGRDQVAVAGKS